MQRHLRIALVLETSGGGSGRHVLDLARGLITDGHDVTVIWSPDRARQDFMDGLRSLASVTTIKVDMHRSVGLNDLASVRELALAIEARAPFDVLHAHSSKAGALVRLVPRRIPGVRIYTPHAFRTMDPDLKEPMRSVYSMIERLLSERGSQIITVSQAEYDHARSIGIGDHLLSTVVNGVDLPRGATRAAARCEMGLDPDTVAIGFVGRLDPQKDPLRFVQAIQAAAQKAPKLIGVVIGDGPLLEDAERVASPEGRMRFMGWQDGPRLMLGLDVFCMTSVYEAMPYTLLEAVHAGLPIVATDIGGANETIVEGKNGHIVPLDCTPEDLGACLATFAKDRPKRARFGESSLHMARARTVAAMVAQTVQVYERALSEVSVLARVS
ncbi:MAG: glycosyltransferase [Pseudomonadota bacterium]